MVVVGIKFMVVVGIIVNRIMFIKKAIVFIVRVVIVQMMMI